MEMVSNATLIQSQILRIELSSRCFWAVTIFGVIAQAIIYFTLTETYGPRILYNKAEKIRKETGNETLRTEFEQEDRSLKNTLRKALVRVVVMLTTQPIIIFLSAYMATVFGIIYLMLVSISIFGTLRNHSFFGRLHLTYHTAKSQAFRRFGQNTTTNQSALEV